MSTAAKMTTSLPLTDLASTSIGVVDSSSIVIDSESDFEMDDGTIQTRYVDDTLCLISQRVTDTAFAT
jgi:hypothetical protein